MGNSPTLTRGKLIFLEEKNSEVGKSCYHLQVPCSTWISGEYDSSSYCRICFKGFLLPAE